MNIEAFRQLVTKLSGLQHGRRRALAQMCSIGLAAAMLFGCGEQDEPAGMTKKAIEYVKVPQSVRDAARKALPTGVNLDEAWENLDSQGKLHSYEIRGKNASDGKIREVRVSLSGQILEME